MKMLTIEPVERPKSFDDVEFTMKEWDTATKVGKVTVPFPTAMEALRNSKGLYRVAPEPKQEVEMKVGGLAISEMTPDQLKLMALNLGIRLQKKMKTADLRGLIERKFAEIEIED